MGKFQRWVGCGVIAGAAVVPGAALGQVVVAVPLQPAASAQPLTAAQPARVVVPTPQPVVAPPPEGLPGQVGAAAPAANPDFSPQEIARLRSMFNGLTEREKAALIAVYQDMGVDLAAALGIKAAAAPIKPFVDAVRGLDFSRKPDAVLAARSQAGFSAGVMPDRQNGEALAKWLHMNVLAGEWGALDAALAQSPPDEATAVYSHILRSTNEGYQGLLPEEVLALGDACPGVMVEWQLDVLSQMLKSSAARYGKGPFLERVKAGTRLFGPKDVPSRERTVRLLVGAGLALEAYEFLPSLEAARKEGDARVIYAHGRYHEDLAASGRLGPEGDDHLREGWALLCEVSLMPEAEVPLRKDAMRRAIDLLPGVPPAQATEWLGKVFANEALGPAALEVVALQAMSFRDKKVDAAKRAQGLATMKSAVDTLLTRPDLNMETLRVPLRMVTSALADEVDAVVKEKGEIRGVSRETELLFRASPDERWLAAIEPSVAIRGYRAAMSIATIADETDVALDVLANAAKRFPAQSAEFANDFLVLWEKRLNPKARPGEDFDNPFIFYQRDRVPAAPLTRGRQRRNLERLERLLGILDQMGVPGRHLPGVTTAFKACHAKTEVFDREEIVRVFGPIEQLDAATAASLAEAMRSGLGGDWRNRQVQKAYGMSRSAAEIGDMVEAGYELAIELAGRAVALEPGSWRNSVLKAGLSYDRVQFKQAQKKDDFTKYNEYRRQAFGAFEQASTQYADLVVKGQERDNSGVYLQWFSAVLDAGQPVGDSRDEAAAETALADDQIARIASAMKSLPADAYQRHVGVFARDVAEALSGIPPERKPTIVRAAVKIVGDHPAGAPIRRLNELYEDLLKNEIRLRITVDGADRVSSGRLFGAVLTLRYTNSVDRETGGFDKYLYQDAFVRIGNQYRSVNYQAQIRRGIETALGQNFTLESIGFFEPLTPSRAVKEDGQAGWQEKPMAYFLIKAKDPSVDRIPQISFDMHFDDQTGPVTLPILSNSPPIDAAGEAVSRPVKNLEVQQTVDARRLVAGTDDRAVLLEVYAKADGVIPELTDLLDGLDAALPGYAIAKDGIETRPYSVVQTDDGKSPRWYSAAAPDEKKTYVTADENGVFRLNTERSWLVKYTPTGSKVAGEFALPKLKPGGGKLTSRQYADMDIVPVQGLSIPVTPRWSSAAKLGFLLGSIAAAGAVAWMIFRRRKPAAEAPSGFLMPGRITPLSTIAGLERLAGQPALDEQARASLASDIAKIQRAFFAPGDATPLPDEAALRTMLERWSVAARR